jgi:hypothetical protein
MATDAAKNAASCFECDAPAEHDHRIIPHTRGGKRTTPPCRECHMRVPASCGHVRAAMVRKGDG